jgi:hypothetical protein
VSTDVSEEHIAFILPPDFTLVSCSAYFSTLKMGAICSSEMSVDTQQTTQRYIQEDGTLLKSHSLWIGL